MAKYIFDPALALAYVEGTNITQEEIEYAKETWLTLLEGKTWEECLGLGLLPEWFRLEEEDD